MADGVRLVINRLGAQGDGIADDGGARPIFIPFALPSETIVANVDGDRGRLIEVVHPSPGRVAPVCRHFGSCGGCATQHLSRAASDAWKQSIIEGAFRARGLSVTIAPVIHPTGGRRRANFAAARNGADIDIGFHAAQSHTLVNIEECPVLERSISSALGKLRATLAILLPRRDEASVAVTATRTGLDVNVVGISKSLSADMRARVSDAARDADLARLSIDGEPVYEARHPVLAFSGSDVAIPVATFVQAMEDAEAQLARLAVDAVGKVKSVADLFSGAGAFTFALARRARVAAFDNDRVAIETLMTAARHATGIKPIAARQRDLFREPLSPLELNEHDAVVFDPPRAGAEAQARMLARCKVRTVVAISCSPATLARDSKILIDGGYRMGDVTPIDQFQYSSHIEAFTVFRR